MPRIAKNKHNSARNPNFEDIPQIKQNDDVTSNVTDASGLSLKPISQALQQAFSTIANMSRSAMALTSRVSPGTPAPQVHWQRRSSLKPVRIETLEPRVLLSGDVNPAALSVNGTIGVQGERDQYEFTVQDTTSRVVFDSLTNRSDLTWKLEGPTGVMVESTFADSRSPVFELAPGKYKITIDGVGDAKGDYSLRLIDADAAIELTPGVDVSGSLKGGLETAVYRFNVTAGEEFYFKTPKAEESRNDGARWVLIDPYGRQEHEGSIHYDKDRFSLSRTGTYLLVIEGQGDVTNGRVGSRYSFNLQPIQDKHLNLSLNTDVTASIDHYGQSANFSFSLATDQEVLFDDLTGLGEPYWSLEGPSGSMMTRRAMNNSQLYDKSAWLHLPAGDYVLKVNDIQANESRYDSSSWLGEFKFRLLSKARAQNLSIGSIATGELTQFESRMYQLSLQAGDHLLVHGRSVENGTVKARLIDTYGAVIMPITNLTDVPSRLTVNASSNYWLVLEAQQAEDTDLPISYELALYSPTDIVVPASLALGQKKTGLLTVPGQKAIYDLSLAATTEVLFDCLTKRQDLKWSLTGPRGVEKSKAAFGANEEAVLHLLSGNYRLVVEGEGAAVGDFEFKLLDLSLGDALTVGSRIDSVLESGSSTKSYRFIASAGDRVALDSIAVNGGTAQWRLIDAYGRDVAGTNDLASDGAIVNIRTNGIYTLLIAGAAESTQSVAFSFQLNSLGNVPPAALPYGDPLDFDNQYSGILPAPGSNKAYRFTLDEESTLIFDASSYDYFMRWSLMGPRGQEVTSRSFLSGVGSENYGSSLLRLVPGEYALIISFSSDAHSYYLNQAYSFQLQNAADQPELLLDSTVTGSRVTPYANFSYLINANAGDTLILTQQLNYSYSYGGSWSLIDANGVLIKPPAFGPQEFKIDRTGQYTLLNELTNQSSYNYPTTFSISKRIIQTESISLNNLIAGNLESTAQINNYDFNVDSSNIAILDVLDTNPVGNSYQLEWRITGSLGVVRDWTSFAGIEGDYAASGKSILYLPSGPHTLSVRSTVDALNSYKVRLLSPSTATFFTPGSPVSATTSLGETKLHQFNAQKGERFYLKKNDEYRVPLMLVDSFGRIVSSVEANPNEYELPRTGKYWVVASPYSGYGNTDTLVNYDFNLQPIVTRSEGILLDRLVTGTISEVWQKVKYSFSLSKPTKIVVSGQTGQAYWSLQGPRGPEASMRSMSTEAQFFDLPAGNYEFNVSTASYGQGLGDYAFKILDASRASPVLIDTPAQVNFANDDRTFIYKLSLTNEEALFFDVRSSLSDYTSGRWSLWSERGIRLKSESTRSDSKSFQITAGNYYVLINKGVTDPVELDFSIRRASQKTLPINLGNIVNESLAIGQRASFTFSLNEPTKLYFDSLTNNADLKWELLGPNGTAQYTTQFNRDSEYNAIDAATAGAYTLNVWSTDNLATNLAFKLINLGVVTSYILTGTQTVVL
jgi:hypothetical protein